MFSMVFPDLNLLWLDWILWKKKKKDVFYLDFKDFIGYGNGYYDNFDLIWF